MEGLATIWLQFIIYILYNMDALGLVLLVGWRFCVYVEAEADSLLYLLTWLTQDIIIIIIINIIIIIHLLRALRTDREWEIEASYTISNLFCYM